jgi:outer membrane PBP1 activator LpoA protein
MKVSIALSITIGAVLASLLFAGCSTKPADELQMAGVAMEGARSVEASKYAPQGWEKAQMQWQEAAALIRMGHYSEARSVLVDAIASFNDAQETAKRTYEKCQIESKALLDSAETRLEKIEQVSQSSQTKPFVRRRVEASLPNLDAKIAAMKTEMDAKEYRTARRDGQEVDHYMAGLEKRLGISK